MANQISRRESVSVGDSEDQLQVPPKEPSLLQEFKATLEQQNFGINAYRIISSTGTSVETSLTLSDGQVCVVELSQQGYQVLTSGFWALYVDSFLIDIICEVTEWRAKAGRRLRSSSISYL